MKKEILIIIVAATIIAAGASTAKAVIPPLQIPGIKKIDPAVMKAWHDARCAKFKEKIEEKNSIVQTKHENHLNAYNNLVSRLETLISRLNEKGFDTAQLETDLNTLKDKIATFKADADKLKEKISSVKDNVCADEDAKIKTGLGEIRTLVDTVKKDSKNIRDFYKNEIRSDIKAVKGQKASN